MIVAISNVLAEIIIIKLNNLNIYNSISHFVSSSDNEFCSLVNSLIRLCAFKYSVLIKLSVSYIKF
jgi:hypothetical protein